ncbi:transcriptional regulator [Vibrio cholerae]|nr:transcriptional regulator [Vibrio cholerae]
MKNWKNGGYSVHPVLNKRLKRACQRAAFPVPLSRGGYGCCV